MGMTTSQKELAKVQSILNGKPEVLTAIVKHRTHQRGQLGDLYITGFSLPDSVTIAIHPPPSNREHELELKFDPPVKDAFEVRERLFEWRDKAFEHFDVPACPAITYYSRPALFPYFLPIIIALSVQLFALFGTGSNAEAFRQQINQWGGKGLLPASAIFAGVVHFIFYPIYVFIKFPQHRVPFVPAVKWLMTIVIVGIAGLDEFWNCVEYEKIRHIYSRTDVGRLPHRGGSALTTEGAGKAKTS